MTTWMEDHSSSVEYTAGYYREQEPEFINFCAIMNGIEPISIEESFIYCELGCGLGMTSLIMAANHPNGKFIAIDYNPSHIAHATRLAEKANITNIQFLELSFHEICSDESILPACDFITFHGIYSWVSNENRQNIVTICKNHLKSGGLVYNSYNAQPGWSVASPLQHMINHIGKTHSGSSLEKMQLSIDYINRLEELNPLYFQLNDKALGPRLEMLKSSNSNYLALEYMNDGWQAFHCTDVIDNMSTAKLSYMGLCNPAEAYSYNIMPKKLLAMLNQLDTSAMKEMVKDIAYNTSFRKDLYTRGGRKITQEQQLEWLKNKEWILLNNDPNIEYKFSLSVGEATGNKENYQLVINTIKDSSLTTLEIIEKSKLETTEVIQILTFLYSGNIIAIKHNNQHTTNLNEVILTSNVMPSPPLPFLAPNIGSAIYINPIEQGFFSAYLTTQNKKDITHKVYKELESKGLNFTQDGNTYIGNAMKDRLQTMVDEWHKKTLPLWESIGII